MLPICPHGRRIGKSWLAARRTTRSSRRREMQRPDQRQPAPKSRATFRHPSPSRLPQGLSSILRRPIRSLIRAKIPIAPVLPAAPFNPACNEVRNAPDRPAPPANLTEPSRFPNHLMRDSRLLFEEGSGASRIDERRGMGVLCAVPYREPFAGRASARGPSARVGWRSVCDADRSALA